MKRRLKPAKHHLRKKQKRLDRNFFKICRKLLSITVGAALASIGLEIFLIPNNIIDGGVVGISIMASYLSGLPVGLFLLVLNLPFLFLGYRQIGKTFALFTLYAVICLSAGVSLLHVFHGMTDDDILAALFGGVILGMGVGLIIRNGGSLDGTEIVAIIFDRRTSFSVGEIVMFFNLFILSSAGVVFGWENAMYSLLAYYVAFKTIDVTIEGLNSTKGVFIVSEHYIAISDAIKARLGREYTIIKSNDDKNYTYTIFVMITRLEIAKLKLIVSSFDKDAMIAISSVEIEGKRFRKKAIH
ncbi:YitT family protein [Anoxybacterium hadale]|uniref:YitT family protein n=1 Tax=Anoxybacterium hadale TaxID=3408580 RepID=A0ACD1A8F7_9FIRM|nr:YitT family protein [Clostridiales bacterium]